MSKKRTNRNRSSPAKALTRSAPETVALPRWKLWLFRIVLAVVPAGLFLCLLEAGLRLAGYGWDTHFFLKDETGRFLHENPRFVWRFYSPQSKLQPHPFLIPAVKAPGTVRVFVLGESAALGTPDPNFGFWRILDHSLRRQFPERKFEFINAAVRGINSHIILPIARECAQQEPDLFIVYMGNNEVVGLHAPAPGSTLLAQNRLLLQTVDWFKGAKSGQWITSMARGGKKPGEEEQDMEFFRAHRLAADDARRQAVTRNFEANLDEICAVATASGAKVILCTIPVNLRDCPPLGSLHRADLSPEQKTRWDQAVAAAAAALDQRQTNESISHLQTALTLDDHFAELHFRLAEALAGDPAKARSAYLRARDLDALQFRADGPMNEAIRRVAARHNVRLIDLEEVFQKDPASLGGVPGRELFYEHVHLRFGADHLVARTLFPWILSELALATGRPAPEFPPRETCAGWLALTRINETQLESSILKLVSGPPFLDQYHHGERLLEARQALTNKFGNMGSDTIEKSVATYFNAMQQATNDWHLPYNFGVFLTGFENYRRAAEQFATAHALMPQAQDVTLALAASQAKAGHRDLAIATLEGALRRDPKFTKARQILESLR